MRTYAQELAQQEARQFIGREEELRAVENWLSRDSVGVYNVYGPGGIGKSSLLRAVQTRLRADGRRVVLVSADTRRPGAAEPPQPGTIVPTLADALVAALDCGHNEVVDALNASCPVVLFDQSEDIQEVARYLRYELLPHLAIGVKVLVASRTPLALLPDQAGFWQQLVTSLSLRGLTSGETGQVLSRFGLHDPQLTRQCQRLTGGHPAAVALAATLLSRDGVRDLDTWPAWRVGVRAIIENLLREVDDPPLLELLDVCAVVHTFTEGTLAAIADVPDVRDAFARLCLLSLVSASRRGLALRDDVRPLLAGDLRWRHPRRYGALRQRALDSYRRRLVEASGDERAWLIRERLYLWGNELLHDLLFAEPTNDQVTVEQRPPANAHERAAIESLWLDFIERFPGRETTTAARQGTLRLLRRVMDYPNARWQVARNRRGALVGFATVLPICRETVTFLSPSGPLLPLVHAYLAMQAGGDGNESPQTSLGTKSGGSQAPSLARLPRLPAAPSEARLFLLPHLAFGGADPPAVRAALLQQLTSIFTQECVLLCATAQPAMQAALTTLGFEHLPESHSDFWGAHQPSEGYVLDLARTGLEPWLEAITSGRRPPPVLTSAQWEAEVQRVLANWSDDARLAESVLAQVLAVVRLPPREPMDDGAPLTPDGLRQVIQEVLDRAQTEATPPDALMFRAVSLAYLEPSVTNDRAAQRLAVSRATFYRLLKRGVPRLAALLSAAARRGTTGPDVSHVAVA